MCVCGDVDVPGARPLLTNAIAILRHPPHMQIRATMLTIKLIYREHVWYSVLHHTVAKWSFHYWLMFFAVHVYIEKKHQQCKLQRVIYQPCAIEVSVKRHHKSNCNYYWQPPPSFPHTLHDLHWYWPCCFWPLHLNLLYTDSLAHTMHETSSATANVITLLLYCFMHTINPLRTVYFCLVPQPIQTFFFVYPCVCDIIILNNISSHLSQHPSVDKKLGSKHL